jgi:glutathione S-transferase
MEWVAIVVAAALVEYAVFLLQCGQARGRCGVAAPATVGHPIYERHFRVQMNTIEHLVMFVPGMVLFGLYVSPVGAACVGLVFILGRALYARAYVRDPARRGPGFVLTLLADVVLVLGGGVGAVLRLL